MVEVHKLENAKLMTSDQCECLKSVFKSYNDLFCVFDESDNNLMSTLFIVVSSLNICLIIFFFGMTLRKKLRITKFDEYSTN